MPRFSVIVPAYNASATIRETLDAILAQEYSDWECVVVDDGSTDSTPSIVEAYCACDPRFRLVRQENRGTAGAYRTGVVAAVSDLLVICAADDLLLPEHLLVMDEFVTRNPDHEIYSSNGQHLDHESGRREVVYSADEWQHERSLSFEQVVGMCFFSVGAVFRRETYEQTGGHRLGVYVDDYDFWLRAMARGARHRYTPRVLSVHRVSSFQQSASFGRVVRSNIEVYEYLLAHEDIDPEGERALRQSIAKNREMVTNHDVGTALETQAQQLRLSVEKVVGARLAGPVLSAIHKVSWISRPVRRLVARLRSR